MWLEAKTQVDHGRSDIFARNHGYKSIKREVCGGISYEIAYFWRI